MMKNYKGHDKRRYTRSAQMFMCYVRLCLLPCIWHLAGVNHAVLLFDGPKPQLTPAVLLVLDSVSSVSDL